MASNHQISEADRELFRQSVGAVKKIRHSTAAHQRRRSRTPSAAGPREAAAEVIQISTTGAARPLTAGDRLSFKRPGIQDNLFHRLRRGHLSMEDELDLHGLTIANARPALGRFLRHCRQQELRCVRIIHGKGRGSANGKPVIKNELDAWLRRQPEVLAFCSAPVRDGGAGAVYVLLKTG